MKIETKFNVGDEVLLLNYRHTKETECKECNRMYYDTEWSVSDVTLKIDRVDIFVNYRREREVVYSDSMCSEYRESKDMFMNTPEGKAEAQAECDRRNAE